MAGAQSGKTYHLLLFDFFNTLVQLPPERSPTLEVKGRVVVSTAHLLNEELAEFGLSTAEILRAMEAAQREARRGRGSEYREVPALRRFEHMSTLLGVDETVAPRLLKRHMQAVSESFVFPQAHIELLARLRRNHRLGIFSNFDHAPTLLALLENLGLVDWFSPIIISEQIGFRKPGQLAFRHALALAAESVERILFIGDSLKDDVAGALGVGLDVAWLNLRKERHLPHCKPTWELPDLLALEGLLFSS